MKTGTKAMLIFGGAAFALALVSIIGVLAFTYFRVSRGTEKMRADYRKQTAAAVGTITNASLNTSNKEYTFQYVVNGVTYTGITTSGRTKTEDNSYRKLVGKKATVCYDPNDPNNSDFKLLEVLSPEDGKQKCFGQ
jgi:hypothetical protein